MAYRTLAKTNRRIQGPTAPRKRHVNTQTSQPNKNALVQTQAPYGTHPLTDVNANQDLKKYESEVRGRFERIIPLLKRVSSLQHEEDFVARANELTKSELGFSLPSHLLYKAWVSSLDMRALFAWCVFQSHQQVSNQFFNSDPLNGAEGNE